jgi:hypothetical protein
MTAERASRNDQTNESRPRQAALAAGALAAAGRRPRRGEAG